MDNSNLTEGRIQQEANRKKFSGGLGRVRLVGEATHVSSTVATTPVSSSGVTSQRRDLLRTGPFTTLPLSAQREVKLTGGIGLGKGVTQQSAAVALGSVGVSGQLEKCRENEAIIMPTCSTISYEVFGTASRHAEVRPYVEEALRRSVN